MWCTADNYIYHMCHILLDSILHEIAKKKKKKKNTHTHKNHNLKRIIGNR